MSKISDFRAYWHRKYNLGDGIIDEGERELAQLPAYTNNRTYNNPDCLYQGYAANFLPNITQVYLDDFLGQNQYAGYGPGLVYLPKKYYTIADILPQNWFGSKGDLIDIYDEFIEPIKTDTRVGRHRYYPCHTNPMVRFIDDPDIGIFMFWYAHMDIVYDVIYNDISHIYTRSFVNGSTSFRIDPIILTYDTPVTQLKWGGDTADNDQYWYCNGPDGYVRVSTDNYAKDSQFWAIEIDLGNNLSENIDTALPSWKNMFLRALQNIYKMKFYPCTRYTSDTRYVSPDFNGLTTDSWTISRSALSLNRLPMLIDVSDCPNFPQNGFYEPFATMGNSSAGQPVVQALTRIDRGKGGPGSNNPDDREDDPNDEDNKPNPDDKGGDGDHDDTDDDIPKPGLPTLSATGAGLITVFSPTQSQLLELGSKLWNPDALEAIKQFFSNPMDTVLGLAIIPVRPLTAEPKEIMLGVYSTQVFAPVVHNDYVTIDCGSIPITRYYGSYLDYSPYTHIKCYLPYIGEIDISPDEAMQKNLNVQYYVNVVTGDLSAFILLDGDLFYTATGNCIRQLPLSSRDYSGIISTAVNATSTIISAAATAGVGNAMIETAKAAPRVTEESMELASAKAAASNVGSSNALVGDVMGAKMRYHHAGSLGTGSGQLCRQKPYLIIERPNLDLASNYKSFVGYPCNKTKKLGQCRGFTQVEATNISVRDATDVELAMIKELLMEGVIF